jgi:hypothetical protein
VPATLDRRDLSALARQLAAEVWCNGAHRERAGSTVGEPEIAVEEPLCRLVDT